MWWGSSRKSSRGGRGPQRGGRYDLNYLLELLHDEVVIDLQEGGERSLMSDPCLEVSVVIPEPTKDVEDQDTVLHKPAKVTERVHHTLHLAVELTDGEVTLDEHLEARIKTKSPSLGVAQKLALERQLGPTSVQIVVHEVVEI